MSGYGVVDVMDKGLLSGGPDLAGGLWGYGGERSLGGGFALLLLVVVVVVRRLAWGRG